MVVQRVEMWDRECAVMQGLGAYLWLLHNTAGRMMVLMLVLCDVSGVGAFCSYACRVAQKPYALVLFLPGAVEGSVWSENSVEPQGVSAVASCRHIILCNLRGCELQQPLLQAAAWRFHCEGCYARDYATQHQPSQQGQLGYGTCAFCSRRSSPGHTGVDVLRVIDAGMLLLDITAGYCAMQCLLVSWYVVFRWHTRERPLMFGGLQPSHLTEGHQVVVLGGLIFPLQLQLCCSSRWPSCHTQFLSIQPWNNFMKQKTGTVMVVCMQGCACSLPVPALCDGECQTVSQLH
jgi:hypothetical protein